MADVSINSVSRFGVNRDRPVYKLPPGAWEVGENVRILGEGIGAYGLGWASVLGDATEPPTSLLYIKGPTQPWWIYTSETKAYVISGLTHTEITRGSGVYTASEAKNWNSTILGGIPILNNGLDVPQYWSQYSPGQLLQNLTNWPSTLRAKFIKTIGPYVMAAHLTESGASKPHRVLWSHPAAPGSVPSSWDPTDETKDSRQVDLPDSDSGLITEMQPLKEAMLVYKESSIHRFRPNGGRTIFSRDTLSESAGCLSPRCVARTANGQAHISLASDDLILVDGVRVRSLLTNRWKRALFNQISTDNIENCFMFGNPSNNEIFFIYPEVGSIQPTRGFVWNYSDSEVGAPTEITIPEGIVAANLGDLNSDDTTTWEDFGTQLWDDDFEPWHSSQRRKVVLVDNVGSLFHVLDGAATRNGISFTGTLLRTGLPVSEADEEGNPKVDFKTYKMYDRLWLDMKGDPVQVRMGFQTILDGPITWTTSQAFDPRTQRYVDFPSPVTGVAFCLEISSISQFLLTGYTVGVQPAGQYP